MHFTFTFFIIIIIIIIIIIALSFWKLSAFVCQIEISQILNCFMLTSTVATVLPLDALPRLMPSVGILVYSVVGLF